eukprot:14137897-Ditylum_brightwellii.AAC.1
MNDLQALLNSASPGGVEAVPTGHAHQLPRLSTHFDCTGGPAEVLRKSDTLCLSHSPSSMLDGKIILILPQLVANQFWRVCQVNP